MPCGVNRVPKKVSAREIPDGIWVAIMNIRNMFLCRQSTAAKKVLIEFESVYHNAEVYINGKKAAYRPYGYTNFYVDTEGFLKYEAQNEIRVIARNSDQPNSRWYSGTGIYRPVYLWTGDQKYIPVNGIKIHTVSYAPAVIEVEIKNFLPGQGESRGLG